MLNGPNRFMRQSKIRPFHHWLYISIKPREKKYDSHSKKTCPGLNNVCIFGFQDACKLKFEEGIINNKTGQHGPF